MALAAAFDLETNQFDVQNAFPHADLDETVYCECPHGFEISGKCLLLKKALYGLRRAPRLWQKKFTARLIELRLRQISEEPCFFVNDYIFLLFFTDDTVTLSRLENRERALAFKKSLMESFDIVGGHIRGWDPMNVDGFPDGASDCGRQCASAVF